VLEKEARGRGEKVTVKLERDDISLLISLLNQEIDRAGEVKEEYGFCDPSYFYRLVDMCNKLLAIPVAEELPAAFNDKEWEEFFTGKRVK